jgi:hypothetical protein
MTPKEQAKELINKFQIQYVSPMYLLSAKAHSKQCALIAVDGIIDALSEYDNRNNTYELQNMDRDFNYWQQVKQEIEKL